MERDRVIVRQGFACAGPDRAFPVMYAEQRGADEEKAAARVVKLVK